MSDATKMIRLTPREADVACLAAQGLRNKNIAWRLGISTGTVKMHLHNIYGKFGVNSRTQLALALIAIGQEEDNVIPYPA